VSGRTVSKWTRVYADGYDISGDSRAIGPLINTYDQPDLTGFSHAVKGSLPGHAMNGIGTFNGVFNNTTSTGVHGVLGTAGGVRKIMIALGMRAEPVAGDPVYMGEFEQASYQADPAGVYVNADFNNSSARASTFLYSNPWGVLLHAKSAVTAANSTTGAGIDTAGASTAFGGYLVYQVFAGDGTATISVDDSADDSSYSALSGATSGEIDFSTPTAGRVAIGRTATVRQYLRWQISLNSATSVTFALGFSRALF
jgi:hypothetical protein